jgi:hypothetical protein
VWETLGRMLVELGVLGALAGFVSNRWSARYTADLNAGHARELQLLQSKLEFSTHVTKAQFEAEHRALTTIWGHLQNMRAAYVTACIPSGRFVEDEPNDPGEREKWLVARVNQLVEARNQVVTAVHSHEPFYSDELRDRFEQLIVIAQRESIRIVGARRFESDWYDMNDQRRADFTALIASTRDLIRERFQQLTITPD